MRGEGQWKIIRHGEGSHRAKAAPERDEPLYRPEIEQKNGPEIFWALWKFFTAAVMEKQNGRFLAEPAVRKSESGEPPLS